MMLRKVKDLFEERIFNREEVLNATLKKNKRNKFDSTIWGLTGVPTTIERYGLVALLELAGEVNL